MFSNKMVYMNRVSHFEFLRMRLYVPESWVVFSYCKNNFLFRWAREPSVFVLCVLFAVW